MIKRRGKLVSANGKDLMVTWKQGNVTVVNTANGVKLYDRTLFTDIIDIEDVSIAADGDAIFMVTVYAKAKTASEYKPENTQPKMKYPYETVVEKFEARTVPAFVAV